MLSVIITIDHGLFVHFLISYRTSNSTDKQTCLGCGLGTFINISTAMYTVSTNECVTCVQCLARTCIEVGRVPGEHSVLYVMRITRKQTLRSLSLPYPHKDWRAGDRQSFFGYDTDYRISSIKAVE